MFIRGVVGWERVTTPFCTKPVTWRFRLHENVAAISQMCCASQWQSYALVLAASVAHCMR